MQETQKRISNETFRHLAFPVAKVRYAGPTNTQGGRFIASMYRDSERRYRATREYRYEEETGSAQAIHAATLCLAKALEELDGSGAKVSDYVAIPGDFDADTYTFTFVPTYFFE